MINAHEVAFLENLELDESPTIFDVGANIGDWAQHALNIWPDAQVSCFEPNPFSLEALSMKRNVKIYDVGLSTEKGDATLYSGKSPDLTASLYHRGISHNPGKMKIKTDRLDNYIDGKVDLLKIDVEGGEYNVMIGAGNFLNPYDIKNIFWEFNDWSLYSGNSFKDFWELLTPRGYIIESVLSEGTTQSVEEFDPTYDEESGKAHRDFWAHK
jgi:FkbM family methyltransferase